ncbi:CLUMA_CG006200, isoform A [Clunio marinus]|uniref:Gustatory receptor n=1 Tax=Clunio marinus TaxID=568069 RepID=A0A1J1HZ84_9DIPT|nr:CLUMA_CG006200, isoform A [Clunio marinus]
MVESFTRVNVDKKKSRSPIVESLDFLFYLSRLLGVIPYSLSEYVSKKRFELSQFGNIFCLVSMIHFIAHYQFLMGSSIFSGEMNNSSGTLTTVIGIFIIYLEPLMMAVDVLASLINQNRLISIFDRLKRIDDKLVKENISLNYQVIRKYSIIFIAIAAICEISLQAVYLISFDSDPFSWYSLYWFVVTIPTFSNSVAKTWFLVLILLVQQRLRAINDYLNDTKRVLSERKMRNINTIGSNHRKDNLFMENIEYLEKEFLSTRNAKIKSDNAWAVNSGMTNKVNDFNIFGQTKSKSIIKVRPFALNREEAEAGGYKRSMHMNGWNVNDRDILIGDKMDEKLINLCRAHDEICEIAKEVNRMFSLQMLLTMAYGFLLITAEFYFLYCGLLKQPVSTLFERTSNIPITISAIVYTAYKCVVVIYFSWKTKVDSQKTGIQLHKIANVVDESHCYNVCNHLSLKLLNHHLNFTACGFFDLDMTTIYAISGAITSYLIILIQFNLAAIRERSSSPIASLDSNALQWNNGTKVELSIPTFSPPTLDTINP